MNEQSKDGQCLMTHKRSVGEIDTTIEPSQVNN